MSRGGLLLRRAYEHQHGLHSGIVEDFLERRIGFRLHDILVAFVEGFAQIFGAVFGVSLLRVHASHREEKQAVVGNGTVLHHRADALIALENVRIEFERFLKFGRRLGKLLRIVIGKPEVRVRPRLARVNRHRPLIFPDGAAIIFLRDTRPCPDCSRRSRYFLSALAERSKYFFAWSKLDRFR